MMLEEASELIPMEDTGLVRAFREAVRSHDYIWVAG
jgi:hypothetical protein